MLTRSLTIILLASAIACTPEKGEGPGEDSGGSTDDGATGTEGAGSDSSEGADETAAPTTGDSDGPAVCPSPEPDARWDAEFTWNDDGPPGFEPGGESEEELRKAACTVGAVDAASDHTFGLDCIYAGETEPRPHALRFTLPAGPGIDLAVGDAVELEYRRSSHFETGSSWHLELHRDGATVLAATDAAEGLFAICFDSDLIAEFSEFGLGLAHASCEPIESERVDFSIDGAMTSLWHGTTGPIQGGFVGVIDTATRSEDNGNEQCSYKVLVYRAAM